MQWFKHDSNASNDAKVKKLLIKYGAVGYAIYFHCLELIAGDATERNINFELEHDSEIIADNLRIKGDANSSGREIVERIMTYIVELGLFEIKGGQIYCYKMLKRIDSSMTSNPKFRELIKKAKQKYDKTMINHDAVMTESCKIRLDKMRSDKIIKEKKRDIVSDKSETPCKEIAPVTKENSVHHRLVDFFDKTHKEIHSEAMSWLPKELSAIKNIIKAASKTEDPELTIGKKINRFRYKFEFPDAFYAEKTFTPSFFYSQWNSLQENRVPVSKHEAEKQRNYAANNNMVEDIMAEIKAKKENQ